MLPISRSNLRNLCWLIYLFVFGVDYRRGKGGLCVFVYAGIIPVQIVSENRAELLSPRSPLL